jgi:hypothetical protein
MPAPFTAQQIALSMFKRRVGSRQEVAAEAVSISASSGHRMIQAAFNPKPPSPVAGGDRDSAARLFTEQSGVGRRPLAEALYVAVRVASFELVLPFLEQAQRHQNLTLSALQQRFRVPPRCPSLPDPVIPQHLLATYDHLVPLAALSGGGSGPAAAPETTQAGALPQPLAAAGRTG